MAIFFITFGFMLLVALMLGAGSLLGRKPLQGSCGGVGKALAEPNYECPLCGGDESKCESRQADDDEDEDAAAEAPSAKNGVQTYDASKP